MRFSPGLPVQLTPIITGSTELVDTSTVEHGISHQGAERSSARRVRARPLRIDYVHIGHSGRTRAAAVGPTRGWHRLFALRSTM